MENKIFKTEEILGLTEELKSPDIEVRRNAALELGKFVLSQAETGAIDLAGIVEQYSSDDRSSDIMKIISTHNQAIDQLVAEKRQIEHAEKRLHDYLEVSGAGTWEWRLNEDRELFDNRLLAIYGYSAEETEQMLGADWDDLVHPDDYIKSKKILNDCIDGNIDIYECELRTRHKNGHWIWTLDRGKVIERDESGKATLILGISTDITDRKKIEEKLKDMSTRDPLTHLSNKEVLRNNLQKIIENNDQDKPTAFMMFDLMGFGDTNKEYGHAIGDNILLEFAKSLNNSFRQGRTQNSEKLQNTDLIARYGGDEFAVILKDLDSIENVDLMSFTAEKSKQVLLGIKNLLLSKGINGFGIYANTALIDPEQHKSYDDIINAADPKLKSNNCPNRAEIIMQIDNNGDVLFWDEIHRCFIY